MSNPWSGHLLTDALKRNDGNSNAAARELGITPRMVRYKIKTLNIDFQKLFGKATSDAGDQKEPVPRAGVLPQAGVRRKMPNPARSTHP